MWVTKNPAGTVEDKMYQGQWKRVDKDRMVMDGVGVLTWPDGSKYVGQFEND